MDGWREGGRGERDKGRGREGREREGGRDGERDREREREILSDRQRVRGGGTGKEGGREGMGG